MKVQLKVGDRITKDIRITEVTSMTKWKGVNDTNGTIIIYNNGDITIKDKKTGQNLLKSLKMSV